MPKWPSAYVTRYRVRIISGLGSVDFKDGFTRKDRLNHGGIRDFISRQLEKIVIQYHLVCSFARLEVAFSCVIVGR